MANGACRNDLIAKLGLTALIIGGGYFITAFTPPLFLLGIPAAAVSVLLGLTAIAVAVHDGCNKFLHEFSGHLTWTSNNRFLLFVEGAYGSDEQIWRRRILPRS